jgi:hypothetical protein
MTYPPQNEPHNKLEWWIEERQEISKNLSNIKTLIEEVAGLLEFSGKVRSNKR